MSATPRRELENLPVAENAKELTAVGNELESLELNSGDSVSCGDEIAKPGQDIPGSHVSEVCTSEIETAMQPSLAHSSDVLYVECSLSGIREETPGTTDGAIVTEECSENGVQKYDRSEHEPHSGGTSDLSTSCSLWDFNQETQDSVENRKVKGFFIGAEHDRQSHVSGCVASESVSSSGTHSCQKKKIIVSRSLVKNSCGTRKSKSVCDTSHVEQNSKYIKSYRTRSVEHTEDTKPNVADMQEFNLENTSASFTELHLQCVDKTDPSPSRYSSPDNTTSASFGMPVAGTALCDVLDVPTSSGVQHEKRMYVQSRIYLASTHVYHVQADIGNS
jgi:hypothetical protein